MWLPFHLSAKSSADAERLCPPPLISVSLGNVVRPSLFRFQGQILNVVEGAWRAWVVFHTLNLLVCDLFVVLPACPPCWGKQKETPRLGKEGLILVFSDAIKKMPNDFAKGIWGQPDGVLSACCHPGLGTCCSRK